MRKLLLLPLCFLALESVLSQDSTAALYIEKIVERIEDRLKVYILEKQDTAIYDADDSAGIREPLIVHTWFYTSPWTMKLEKTVEKSSYRKFTTEIIVYFNSDQPIRFTSIQRNRDTVKVDFDLYYMHSHYVHCVKRTTGKGDPDSNEYLRWCYEFLNSYKKMVKNLEPVHGKLK